MNPLRRRTWSEEIDAWCIHLAARGLAERSIDSYRHTLGLAVDAIGPRRDPRKVTLDDLERLVAAWRAQGLASTTLHNRIIALRSFDRWLAERRGGTNEARLLSPPRRTSPQPRRLTTVDVARMIDRSPSLRDAAIVATLAFTAFRNYEVRNLRIGDVDWEDDVIVLRTGKGGSGRIVPLSASLRGLLAEHVRVLAEEQFAGPESFLFARRYETIDNGQGRPERIVPWQPTGHSAINRVVERAARAAGLERPEMVTPHMFRRWALERFLEETGDLHAAAELAGHRDVNVTRTYAGRAKLARVRSGIAQIDLSTTSSPQNAGSEPSSGRTWVRTRDLRVLTADAASSLLNPSEG